MTDLPTPKGYHRINNDGTWHPATAAERRVGARVAEAAAQVRLAENAARILGVPVPEHDVDPLAAGPPETHQVRMQRALQEFNPHEFAVAHFGSTGDRKRFYAAQRRRAEEAASQQPHASPQPDAETRGTVDVDEYAAQLVAERPDTAGALLDSLMDNLVLADADDGVPA